MDSPRVVSHAVSSQSSPVNSMNLWRGRQVSSNMAVFKQTLPWLVVIIAGSILAQYAYKSWKLQQYVNCEFGETPREQVAHFAKYSFAVQEKGLPEDQFCLARMYEEGLGTDQSYRLARELYEQAAQQGLMVAQGALCIDENLYINSGLSEEEIEKYVKLASSCQESMLDQIFGWKNSCLPCQAPYAAIHGPSWPNLKPSIKT